MIVSCTLSYATRFHHLFIFIFRKRIITQKRAENCSSSHETAVLTTDNCIGINHTLNDDAIQDVFLFFSLFFFPPCLIMLNLDINTPADVFA